jgi:hypothetical protein
MEHTIRRVDYNCREGSQFQYVCDGCLLQLRGFHNKHYSQHMNGWTWELTRNGEMIATAGNEHVQSYGGTEEAAREDGLKRFNAEPCHRPN